MIFKVPTVCAMQLTRRFTILCSAVLVVAAAATSTASAAPGDRMDAARAGPSRHFLTYGDYIHISSTPPRAASAHGWWLRIDNEAALALVRVQLQIKRAGLWLDVGPPGSKVVMSGGGSANRASARVPCVGFDTHEWRSVVDVDLVGYLDSADRHVTPARLLPCAA